MDGTGPARGVLLTLALTVTSLTSCTEPGGSAPAVARPSAVSSGVIRDSASGVLRVLVQVGERCPQEPVTPDPSCSPVPLPRVRVQVVDRTGQVVATRESSASGRVAVRVPAGRYSVRGADLDAYRLTPASDVRVPAGGRVRVLLTYGNGIQ